LHIKIDRKVEERAQRGAALFENLQVEHSKDPTPPKAKETKLWHKSFSQRYARERVRSMTLVLGVLLQETQSWISMMQVWIFTKMRKYRETKGRWDVRYWFTDLITSLAGWLTDNVSS
jgi:hypothetical protein